jgi:YgiT-type zinc finger domain-containing protein
MNCLICREADILDGFTSIEFMREEFKLVINNIPARVCPNCAEAILEEDVTTHLLAVAEGVLQSGAIEEILDYNGIP